MDEDSGNALPDIGTDNTVVNETVVIETLRSSLDFVTTAPVVRNSTHTQQLTTLGRDSSRQPVRVLSRLLIYEQSS